ncbi:MAG: aldehyde dehydrogenase family protein [Methanomicrobiales archaeon]|nr:aldehyde dehydrogenase family protein [Methanomicrobiales archaeon]
MSEMKITYSTVLTDESVHHRFETALKSVAEGLGKRHPLKINGKNVFATSEFSVYSPIDTSLLIGTFQVGEDVHTEAAIAAAKTAFPPWSGHDWERRTRILRKVSDLLEERMFSLAALVTTEVGKTREESIAEISETIDLLRYHAEVYKQQLGYTLPMRPDPEGGTVRSVMRPYGVWAVISPFNFPVSLAAGMISAALLTGNTVVMKPTSKAPLSGLLLYRVFVDGGVPADALQFLTGPGEPFGSRVAGHPDVAGIAFTGSRDAGMWLYRNFSREQPYPKPLIAEMGSKNPAIVTLHADLKKATEGIIRSAFGYSGQKCSATSRVYVHAAVADSFLEGLRKKVQEITVGNPRDKEVFMGPVIDKNALDIFQEAVESCRKSGGKVLQGGKVLTGKQYSRGFYMEPTLVTGLPSDHPLVFKELFVPFLIIETFERIQDALVRANATDYGLTAGIYTENDEEREYFFKHIHSGVCYANRKGGATTGAWPGSQPFGGWKGSGSTGKGIGGPYYLLSYLREQAQTRVG